MQVKCVREFPRNRMLVVVGDFSSALEASSASEGEAVEPLSYLVGWVYAHKDYSQNVR